MTTDVNIQAGFAAVAADVRDFSMLAGGTATYKNADAASDLETTAKNLVGSVNELRAQLIAATLADTDGLAEGSANLYFTEQRVLDTALAGYAQASGAVAATDTVIQALGKLSGNIVGLIDDSASGAATTYSSDKITADIAAAVAAVVDGAPGVLDTINEIAAAMGDDENFATTMANALALKADKAEVFTKTELGVDFATTDYAAVYVAARDA